MMVYLYQGLVWAHIIAGGIAVILGSDAGDQR